MIELSRSYRRWIVGACALCVFGSATLRAQDVPAPAPAATPAPAPVVASVPDEISLHLRMEWGGGAARRWVAAGEVIGGRIETSAPLGVEADVPGSMGVAEGRWFVEPRSPRTYDGVDLLVRGPLESRLILVFSDVENQTQTRHEVPLATLVEGAFHTNLDAQGNRLALRRTPGDRLRVRPAHESLIFDPGEMLRLAVEPHRLGFAPGTALQLTTSIRPARQTRVLSTETIDLVAPTTDDAWPTLQREIRLPEAEGVYDVVFELVRRDFPSRIRMQATAERRVVQVVVLSRQPTPVPPDDALPSSLLVEIDPASPGTWDRMRNMTLPAAMRRGPLGNAKPTTRTAAGTTFVELPALAEPSDPAWQAYPLPVARPGLPHIVEIEYPSNAAQSVGISLLEPNALGTIAPLGIDAGWYVDEADVEPTATKRVQRIVVWPKTAAPLLVVVNKRHDAPAIYGKIRLLGPRAAALPYRPWANEESAALPPLKIPHPREDGRLLAAYFDRPLFPDNFGASSTSDVGGDGGQRSLDDWVTFYDGARRMIEYLQHAGYNGLVLTVAADGGAIYPSTVLEPTPRYDDGLFFGTGQDPLRKDVVELLLRMCDRDGLRFVPAIQFTAPLPQLEALRRAGDKSLAPLGADGFTWTEVHPADGGLGPHYNPLHPRVQQEMRSVVAELMQRYGRHPSLGGVAVNLTADGYTQLPGVEWGLDTETTGAFYRSLGQAPIAPGEAAVATARLLVRHREAWIAWRQEALTKFYGELAEISGTKTAAEPGGGAQRKLYLTTVHAWHRPDVLRRVQPMLPTKPAFEPLLHEAGLHPAALAALPNVEWFRAYRESPLDAPAQHGANVELNRDPALDRFEERGAPAVRSAAIFHEPQSLRLESLEKQSPFQPAYVRLVTQAAAGGSAARRSLVRALATLDAATILDGGWLLPLGAQDDVRRIATIVRSLPAEPFATIDGGPSHVVVRTRVVANAQGEKVTYLYVVNDAPWPTSVTLDVASEGNDDWGFWWLGDEASRQSAGLNVKLKQWRAELQPYDVVACGFSRGDLTIKNPRGTTPPEVAAQLEQRIKQLWARSAGLQRSPAAASLVNAGFEAQATSVDPAPGWERLDGALASVISNDAHEGRQSLRFASRQGDVRLASTPIKIPSSGRLSLSVWLKSPGAAQPSLRLAFAGRLSGREYYRYAAVGGGTPGAPELGPEWRQFVFPLQDLPTQGLADLRVRFELAGAGDVLIDDVRLNDLEFTNTERLELTKAISLAEYRLQRGDFGECVRLLEGYWPRFLMSYAPAPIVDPTLATKPVPRPTPSGTAPVTTEASRRWWPTIFR